MRCGWQVVYPLRATRPKLVQLWIAGIYAELLRCGLGQIAYPDTSTY